ncbi:MAG: hypothetical protein H6Q58_744 [Firmicutes bacterium]|nr:hypothetical protein [Bacillota bacterium]
MTQDNVTKWLLEEDNPSVRFLTLTTLLGKPMKNKDVREASKAIMETGVVPKILSRQNDDGSFSIPERFYRDKYKGTVWTLIILAEMAADQSDERVKSACEFILRHSQDPSSGGFSYDESAKTGTGLPSCVVPCLTGNMVYSLIRLGYLEDERLQKAIEWITVYQRADDAEGKGPTGGIYDRYKNCFGSHTCHMGAAKALKALAAIPPGKRSRDAEQKLAELAEYFLKHHLYKKSHSLEEISRPGWLKLGFPLMYQTDILELLGIFADLGIKDKRLSEAVDILRSKQGEDGKWKLESTSNGKMLATIEKKGEPSKWITLRALKVLRNWE